MDVKILLLINCVAVVYCQYTISGREAAEWQNEYYEDVKSEIESIRQLLMNQKKDDDVCNDRQAMQEMKSDIKDIRRIVSDQNQVLETLRDNWHEIAICPRGFTYLPLAGSCYKVVYESHNWTSAGKKCRESGRGSHLTAITSAAENNALKTFLETELSKNVSNMTCIPDDRPALGILFWTSGQRQIETSCQTPFVWKLSCDETLSFEYTSWLRDEPSCSGNNEHCMNIWVRNNYGWNDVPCYLQFCPLCEYKP